MKTIKPTTRQSGFSLISTMIGLVVSMIGVFAILSLQGNLTYNAAGTIQDARHDGQLSTALLTAQKLVMNAGYGIEKADDTDIVIVETAATATTAYSTSLLWRYNLSGSTICNGLRDTVKTENNIDFRSLLIISSIGDCNEDAPLADLSWAVETGVIGKWRIDGTLTDYLSNNDSLFNFLIRSSTCSPYGSAAPEPHLIVMISAPSSTQLGGLAGAPNTEIEFCLQNTDV